MTDTSTRRLLNVGLRTIPEMHTTEIRMLYPAIYTFSCRLNINNFPVGFNIQYFTLGKL